MDVTDLKLLVLVDATTVGGAETCLGTVLEGLDPRTEVVLCGPDVAVLAFLAARRPGARLLPLPQPTRLREMRIGWALRRALKSERPQVVHANLTSLSSCEGALVVALSLGFPVVAVEHLPIPPRSRWSALLKLATARRLAAHVAVGEEAARLVERHGRLPAGSVLVIRNGVPDRGAAPIRPVDGPVVLGTLGRLVTQKGVDILLRALVQVPHVRLIVGGEGPERAALEDLAHLLGVSERTEFTGWVEEPAERLASCDVLVQPSRSEGLSLVVLEAMFAGRPVVATRVGSTAEAVLHGVTGLLVPPEDPDALGEALRAVCDDPLLRERLGRAARERAASEFDAATMTAGYAVLYAQVRSLGRKARRTVTTG